MIGWLRAHLALLSLFLTLLLTDLGATAKTQVLDSLNASGTPTNLISATALHVADPGTTGTSENANTGSYARQATTWNAASGSTKTQSTSLTFSTAGTVAVTNAAGWSSTTYAGGTYGIGVLLGSSVTAASITIASGALTLTAS